MLDKFTKLYYSIINEQNNNQLYQVVRDVDFNPEDDYISDGKGGGTIRQPQANIGAAKWFEDKYGIRISPNAYICMDLTAFLFTDNFRIKYIEQFAQKVKTLTDDGATFILPYASTGDDLSYMVILTIQQLYKYFDFFNVYVHLTVPYQIRSIIQRKAFYNSSEETFEALNRFGRNVTYATPMEIFNDIIQNQLPEVFEYEQQKLPQVQQQVASIAKKYFNN